MRGRFARLVALVALCSLFAAADDSGKRVFSVMTRNVDNGTDFLYVLRGVPGAVTLTYQEILASDIPGRAARLASEIAAKRPDLIALQEVSLLTTLSAAGQPVLVLDQLQQLMAALEARNLRYDLVAVNNLFNITQPLESGDGFVNLLDRDVVLARPEMRISNVTTNVYTVLLPFGPFTIDRGWISAEVNEGRKKFRFVNTHLESLVTPIQVAQTSQLIQELQQDDLPVVLAGDFNSDASGNPAAPDKPDSVLLLTMAGLAEAWHTLHPNDPGYTWPLFFEDNFPAPPFTSPASPFERIDLIFVRGPIEIRSVERTGTSPPYASDHAGVVATLKIEP